MKLSPLFPQLDDAPVSKTAVLAAFVGVDAFDMFATVSSASTWLVSGA